VKAIHLLALGASLSLSTYILSGNATAQTPASTPAERSDSPRPPASSSILISPDRDYRIGARDVIEIQVEKAPELSGVFAISAGGTFLMPYVGRITALNQTTEDLAKFIADGLRGGYLRNPVVRVMVKQYNSRSFFIQGSVRSPGVYQIDGTASLLKLIILAGGLADNHGSTAFIIRETKPDTAATASQEVQSSPGTSATTQNPENYELIKANINGMLKGQFDQNIPVQPGDIVNIPATDVFFVAGEVQAPGSFPLKEGTTLRQAISLAQGTTFKSATDRGMIFREDQATGKRQQINVDVGAVMNGKKDDIPIRPNDIIIVPNSKLKTVGVTLLSAFGYSAVTHIPY
jgi:polysaccharide biosynthesis/export protein